MIDPDRGSEAGNAWAWVKELARRTGQVSVVTTPSAFRNLHAASGRIPAGVTVVPVPDARRTLPKAVPDWYRTYAAWLDAAAPVVADLGGDVAHHVTVGTPFWGSALNLSSAIRVLGPVGISKGPPPWAWRQFGVSGVVQEGFRSVLGHFPSAWQRGTAGVARVNLALASDARTAAIAESCGTAWRPELIEGVDSVGQARVPQTTDLVWAGRLIPRKGPLLALRAWAAAQSRLPTGARLVIYGDGELAEPLRQEVQARRWHAPVELRGKVSRAEVLEHMGVAHGLLQSSLRDTSSAQMLEALSVGTPPVFLRHGGLATLDAWYPPRVGWSAPVTSERQAVRVLSDLMYDSLSASDQDWASRSRSALDVAKRHTWSGKVERILDDYERLL
jgi:glycosyltransferase involved in cell wall biosynthesis